MKRFVLLAALAALAAAGSAQAGVTTYTLFNHLGGGQNPPPYGLRLDDLGAEGTYTFDFEYDDGVNAASMKLDFDDTTLTVRIYGRAYGGRETGTDYDPIEQGWVDIDFLYAANVIEADDASGNPGNDVYVTAESPFNSGTIHLDGWNGDATFAFVDEQGNMDHSFRFDNDYDPRDGQAAANPMIVSGAGWLEIVGFPMMNGGTRDWLFQAEIDAPTSVEDSSWGGIKNAYR